MDNLCLAANMEYCDFWQPPMHVCVEEFNHIKEHKCDCGREWSEDDE